MNRLTKYLLAMFVLCLMGNIAVAEETKKFLLKGNETVIFFGDSITQNGAYVNYFEAYLLTRFPNKRFRVINHGISSETISGTTEKNRKSPRPWAHNRFERDVTKWKPDLVISCFGMNDGNYRPPDKARYKKYQVGNRRLIQRVRDEAKSKLIIMTSPPYDPYQRKVSDPKAKTFHYGFAAVNYDETLSQYSKWLLTLRQKGETIVDLHTKINQHLQMRRKENVSFYLSPDAVHPNETGHWLMAEYLLLAMHAPADAGSCSIDILKKKIIQGDVANLNVGNAVVTFNWTSPLPMPMDKLWDGKSIALEKVASRLNHYQLQVTGLIAPQYQLEANNVKVGVFTKADLEKGINLLNFPTFSTVEASQKLLTLLKERRRLVYSEWRSTIRGRKPSLKTAGRVKELNVAINNLRKPQKLSIKLSPMSKKVDDKKPLDKKASSKK